MDLATRLGPLGLLALVASPASAQVGTLTSVPGRVVDLSRDAAGELLFCTEERDVGRITTSGALTVLAAEATGPFDCDLVAVSPTPAGDVAVLDTCGDVHVLPAAGAPVTVEHDVPYIINVPSDLIVDATGNFVTVAQTASSGVRALQWISPDGSAWAYYLIEHTPLAAVADPVGGDLILADAGGGGALRRVVTDDPSHPTVPLETTFQPGWSLAADDGDLACEADGDVLSIAGGKLLRFDRASGTTTTLASGLGALRGLAIAASSGDVPSATGWSAYLAEGAGASTAIREVGGVGAPASVVAEPLGTVPDKGEHVLSVFDLNVFDLEVDLAGDLLIGGELWGADFEVRRIELPTLAQTTVAHANDGLPGHVEAVATSADGAIWALSSDGDLTRIEEGTPPTLTAFFSDPLNLIDVAKDLCVDRSGAFYVGNCIMGWNGGSLVRVDAGGAASELLPTEETRGVTADPFTAGLLLSEWNDQAFHSDVDLYDPAGGALAPLPGFDALNMSNALGWGDGKTCVDVLGNVYVTTEDDFSLVRYDRETQKQVRIGSGYDKHPTGVVIARSSGQVASDTGWSVYVAEWNHLYEIPSVPPPAPRRLDAEAPPVGRAVGWVHPSAGDARAIAVDPSTGELLISTTLGFLESMDRATGATATVAMSASPRDMTALATTSAGEILAASLDGFVFRVDPAAGYATSLLHDFSILDLRLRGMTVDGEDRPVLVHAPASALRSELLRAGDSLEHLAFLARGRRPAIDPLTGEVFVTEAGTGLDSGGEVLRVDAFADPPRHGHVRHEVFTTTAHGEMDGGIAFDDAGNHYVASGPEGRVWRHDRATGTRTLVAGNYERPVGLLLAPGTPGTAGPSGTSLFVLDGNTVYEVGVPGLPAPPPPASPPGLAPPADLAVRGDLELGELLEVSIESPADAGRVYWILPSAVGKEPGLPLALLGDPSDPGVIPSNYSDLWLLSTDPGAMPGFVGVLDANGESLPGTGVQVPNSPSLLGLDAFLEFAWIALDAAAPTGVATVGATAQVFLGD